MKSLFEYYNTNENINDLRFKYVIAKDFKYSGIVDHIKGDKLAVEINSDGDKQMLNIDDVYVLSDEQYKQLIDVLPKGKIKFNDQTGEMDKTQFNKVIKSPLLTVKEFK